MDEHCPVPNITWRCAKSGKRNIIESDPISEATLASKLHSWLIAKINNSKFEASGSAEPHDAFEIDLYYNKISVSIVADKGNGTYKVQVRTITPEYFTEITGMPVENAKDWQAAIQLQSSSTRSNVR